MSLQEISGGSVFAIARWRRQRRTREPPRQRPASAATALRLGARTAPPSSLAPSASSPPTADCGRACQASHWKAGHKQFCVAPGERKPQASPAPKAAQDKHVWNVREDHGGSSAAAGDDECPICFDPLAAGALCTLPCTHTFHAGCVEGMRHHTMRASGPGKQRERPSDIQGSSGAFQHRDKRAQHGQINSIIEAPSPPPAASGFSWLDKYTSDLGRIEKFVYVSQEEDRAVQAATDNGMHLLELRRNRNFTMLANPRVVTAAVGQNGNALKYATESQQNNEDIVLAAINSAPSAFQWASARLKKDQSFCSRAALENPLVRKVFPQKMRLLLGLGVDQCTHEDPRTGKSDCKNPVTKDFGGFTSVLCTNHVLKPVCTHKDPFFTFRLLSAPRGIKQVASP